MKQLDQEAVQRLQAYRWPGNIRELENLVRRLAALHPQEVITAPLIDAELDQAESPGLSAASGEPPENETLPDAVERHLAAYFTGFGNDLPPPGLYHRVLRDVEYPLISAALAATRGNQIKAAELLGVNRNTLRKKIRDLDIQLIRQGR